MGKEELLPIQVEGIQRLLTPEEVVHMAKELGAFWTYDYDVAKQGRVGLHAELKSGLHSDGFFISRIFLAEENIRKIISHQMVMRLKQHPDEIISPNYVVGIPDGATKLGEDIAQILGRKCAEMEKVDGRIRLVTSLLPGEPILLVEDFCTRGTGFAEAVRVILEAQPEAYILPYDPVIINRGGLESIIIEGFGQAKVLPVVEWRVQDWPPEECPLCKMGSKPIKPKATDENWKAITTSQLD